MSACLPPCMATLFAYRNPRSWSFFLHPGNSFEYKAIAQKWETIGLEDLKIEKEEVVVVNNLYRMKNLLDETVIANSPRDAVLNLFREINPAVFIHGVVNGIFNAPFLVTQFRESLFHYATLFDMFEATVLRGEDGRIL